MKRFLGRLLLTLLILAGLGYLLFPFVSDQALQYQNAQRIGEYRALAAQLPPGQKQEMLSRALEESRELTGVSVRDMFAETPPRVRTEEEGLLKIAGTDVIGVLEIPSIRVSLPIYPANASQEEWNTGLVHTADTSPLVSEGGHIVVAGLSGRKAEGVLGEIGLSSAYLLRYLDRVQEGDIIYLNALDETWLYQVTSKETLLPSQMHSHDWRLNGNYLTVISNPGENRLLVQAQRLAPEEARDALAREERVGDLPAWVNVAVLGSPVLILGWLVGRIVERHKRRRYRLPVEKKRSERKKG